MKICRQNFQPAEGGKKETACRGEKAYLQAVCLSIIKSYLMRVVKTDPRTTPAAAAATTLPVLL